MIYYTGDIHGGKHEIVHFTKRMNLAADDVIVILGDVGANYYGNERDDELKRAFSNLKPTIFCIHGNHEIRPANIASYKTKEFRALHDSRKALVVGVVDRQLRRGRESRK